jgi:hypothetical protein
VASDRSSLKRLIIRAEEHPRQTNPKCTRRSATSSTKSG